MRAWGNWLPSLDNDDWCLVTLFLIYIYWIASLPVFFSALRKMSLQDSFLQVYIDSSSQLRISFASLLSPNFLDIVPNVNTMVSFTLGNRISPWAYVNTSETWKTLLNLTQCTAVHLGLSNLGFHNKYWYFSALDLHGVSWSPVTFLHHTSPF